MKSPLPYYGGKTRIADQIVALLPPHEHYVEPFCGSLAVLLAKPPSKRETVNDINGDIVRFWRVLRDQPDELIRVMSLTPYAMEENRAAWEPCDSEVEAARRVWVKLSQTRANRVTGKSWRRLVDTNRGKSGAEYLSAYTGRAASAADRLLGVSIDSIAASDVVQRYGSDSGVLLYCDPPYLHETRTELQGYAFEMDTSEHEQLLTGLVECASSVVLSGYASELYDDTLAGWSRTEIQATTSQGADRARTEVVWSNRPFPGCTQELW